MSKQRLFCVPRLPDMVSRFDLNFDLELMSKTAFTKAIRKVISSNLWSWYEAYDKFMPQAPKAGLLVHENI